jgi:hypothetical protein
MSAGSVSAPSQFLWAVREPIHRNTVVDIRGFHRKSKSIGIEIGTRLNAGYGDRHRWLAANCCAKDMGGDVQLVGPPRGKFWSDQFGESD